MTSSFYARIRDAIGTKAVLSHNTFDFTDFFGPAAISTPDSGKRGMAESRHRKPINLAYQGTGSRIMERAAKLVTRLRSAVVGYYRAAFIFRVFIRDS